MDIAVDVDGVLAEQVIPVLEIIKNKYGISMGKEDIKTWDEDIPNTDSNIKKEIEKSHRNDQFVVSMPTIEGSVRSLQHLKSKGHNIHIATNRANVSSGATEEWLSVNGIPYDSFYNTNGKAKADIQADILIDDYPGNIINFYSSNRPGILFLQPWNKGHDCLKEDQIFSADGWTEVVRIIENTA